jgi:hypothetical protein
MMQLTSAETLEALLSDLRSCVIREITLVDDTVQVILENQRREQVTLQCARASIVHAAPLDGLPRWAEWARTIDWAELFGTDTLGLTLCNGVQLFIQTTAAELVQSDGH